MKKDDILASAIEREIRLEQIVKALVSTNNTLETLKEIVSPYADNQSWIYGKKDVTSSWEWEEQHIFNESKLYEALGKDTARSILGVWRRFREICELISISQEK